MQTFTITIHGYYVLSSVNVLLCTSLASVKSEVLCNSLTHFDPSGKSSSTMDLTHPPRSSPAGIVVGVFLPCWRLQGLILHRF